MRTKLICTLALAGALAAPVAFGGSTPAGPGGGGLPPGLANALINSLGGGNVPGGLTRILSGGGVVFTLTPASGVPISNVGDRALANGGKQTSRDTIEIDVDLGGGKTARVIINLATNEITITPNS